MTDADNERPNPDARNGHTASDGLEERGQGAGRLLGEGAEQGIAGEEAASAETGEESGGSPEDENEG